MDDKSRRNLQELFHSAVARKEAIDEQARPLREQREAVQREIHQLEAKEREFTEQIRAIEHPHLIDAMNESANLARALKPHPDAFVARTGPPPPKPEPEVAAARKK